MPHFSDALTLSLAGNLVQFRFSKCIALTLSELRNYDHSRRRQSLRAQAEASMASMPAS